jgi:hypothetical protein
MEIGRRTATVEYGMVACTIALMGTVYFFGQFGADAQPAAAKASYGVARSDYAASLRLVTAQPFQQGLTAQAWRVPKLDLADGARNLP